MKPIAYVQAGEDGLPYSVNGAAAVQGFSFLGYDVKLFRPVQLSELPLTPETIVVGGMGTVQTALAKLGVQPPQQGSIPAVLYPYLGRECWRSTVSEVREKNHFPVFIKPYAQAKVFSGQVVRNATEFEQLIGPQKGFPTITEAFPLLVQELVMFMSEWRAFVVRGAIVGMSHYAGDPLLFPSASVIRITIGAYQNAPAGYSADFGVSSDGRTLLVETNDGYSLGNGGLLPSLYAQLLQARWEELANR